MPVVRTGSNVFDTTDSVRRQTNDSASPAEARRFDHLVEVRAELAALAPGLRLDGRAPAFLEAALQVAKSDSLTRSSPVLLEARAEQRLATEAAYKVGAGGGTTAGR